MIYFLRKFDQRASCRYDKFIVWSNCLIKFDHIWSNLIKFEPSFRYGNYILLINSSTKFNHFWSPCRYGNSILWISFWPHLTTFDHYAGMVTSLVDQLFDQRWYSFCPKLTTFTHNAGIVSFFVDQLFDQIWSHLNLPPGMVNPFCGSTFWPNLTTFDDHAGMVSSFLDQVFDQIWSKRIMQVW